MSKNELSSHIVKLIRNLECSRIKEYRSIQKECCQNSLQFELRMEQAREFYDVQIAELRDELKIVELDSLKAVGM